MIRGHFKILDTILLESFIFFKKDEFSVFRQSTKIKPRITHDQKQTNNKYGS